MHLQVRKPALHFSSPSPTALKDMQSDVAPEDLITHSHAEQSLAGVCVCCNSALSHADKSGPQSYSILRCPCPCEPNLATINPSGFHYRGDENVPPRQPIWQDENTFPKQSANPAVGCKHTGGCNLVTKPRAEPPKKTEVVERPDD